MMKLDINPRMFPCSLLVWIVVLCIQNSSNPQSVAHAADPQMMVSDYQFLIATSQFETRLQLRIQVEGVSFSEFVRPRFEALFKHLDRNGDGQLESAEWEVAPTADWLRRAAWGYLSANRTQVTTLRDADADQNNTVSSAELQTWYVKRGVGAVTVATADSNMTAILTKALWRFIDTDNDHQLSSAELSRAVIEIHKLDADDDETISAREIAASVESPYPNATLRIAQPEYRLPRAALPSATVTLPLKTVDVFADVALRQSAAGAVTRQSPVSLPNEGSSRENGLLRMPMGDVDCTFRTVRGLTDSWCNQIEPQALTHFKSADQNSDLIVTADEAANASNGTVLCLFGFADRNADHQITLTEWQSGLDCLGPVVESGVQLTILSHQGCLFELLDRNRDGSLSRSELARLPELSSSESDLSHDFQVGVSPTGETAPQSQSAEAILEQPFRSSRSPMGRERLFTTLTVFVSRGRPDNSQATSSPAAPQWFSAMDRNRDGVLTHQEFIGPLENFRQFDTNQDGQLSESESELAAARK